MTKKTLNLPAIENIILDEANDVTYVVMAPRVLTDGEVFSAIRIALLLRGRDRPSKGEKLVIDTIGSAGRPAKQSERPLGAPAI